MNAGYVLSQEQAVKLMGGIMAKGMKRFRFTKSEAEVLAAVLVRGYLPISTKTGRRYKRHERAIASLKLQGVIYKDKDHILHIKPKKI